MKPFEDYMKYLKRLQSNYEVGTGQHNVLGIAINEAEDALIQYSADPKCKCDKLKNNGEGQADGKQLGVNTD